MRDHPTHKTRFSDSSLYDEVCIYCGATDARGLNSLEQPCPEAPKEPMSEMELTRAAFLKAIEEDRYDEATRRVFADYLEENGFDDEALIQRKWTKEKQEAEDWLTAFSKEVGLTFDDVIKAGYEEEFGVGMNFKPGDYFYDHGEALEVYWKSWELATGYETRDRSREPFYCCV